MAKRTLELSGQIFNGIEVIERDPADRRYWNCKCVCGNIFRTTPQRLRTGKCKSCGCLTTSLLSESNTKHGGYKQGKNTPEYQSYIAMMHRCYNEDRQGWEKYGGRGILVEEDSWLKESPHGYINFLQDMGKRPEGTSLDRIDGKRGYSKENCRWADARTQSYNTDKKKKSTSTSKYRGVTHMPSRKRPWIARIGNGLGGSEWIGQYETEELAAEAYNKRAIEIWGSEAVLNDLSATSK